MPLTPSAPFLFPSSLLPHPSAFPHSPPSPHPLFLASSASWSLSRWSLPRSRLPSPILACATAHIGPSFLLPGASGCTPAPTGTNAFVFPEIDHENIYMAVQAQYSSNTLVPDFRSRIRHPITNENRIYASGSVPAPGTLQDVLPQPVVANLLRAYNTGLSNGQQTVTDCEIVLNETENGLACNSPASRKRPREGEDLVARQHAFIPVVDFNQNNPNSPMVMTQAGAAISTGLRLALEDNRVAVSTTSTSGRVSNGSTLSSVLNGDLQPQMLKQSEEIAQYIQIQGERMKQAIEEKRQRHTRTLFAIIEERVMKSLKDKNAELEKANRRNLELEERIKQLSLEAQLWQNMARNNEIMASTLRNSLEQVVAQSREQSKEGCGESEVDDAESCHFGEAGDAQARTFQENKELKEQRTCRVCRTNSACILLLPCRHLCLCKDCDGRLGVCPICRSAKNASVQVYMS